jgi:Pentapeptide repeats (8 copies)
MIEIRNRKSGRLLYSVHADTLEGVDLRGAYLYRADLAGANLRGARLSGADLREAILAGADLTGASLCHAALSQSDLTGARLQNADLRRASLWRTRFADADLTGTLLANAQYTQRIRWPEGFDPQASGAWPYGPERVDVDALYRELLGNVRRWVIWWLSHKLYFHFGPGINRPSDFAPLGIQVCPPLKDWLEVGPQHVDLTRQTELREQYYRYYEQAGAPTKEWSHLDAYAQALATGEPVIFWCDPELGSCQGILWALDALHQRGAELRNASLLLWPTRVGSPPSEPETRRVFEQLVPVPEVLQPLIAIRRQIASDSNDLEVDLSSLPPQVREWAALTRHMEDYLPDQRGLAVPDAHLLNLLNEEWQSGTQIMQRFPRPQETGWGVMWSEHLRELCDAAPYIEDDFGTPDGMLAQARARRSDTVLSARFRITPLGIRVRAGQEDALACGWFSRWVGGRLITQDRPLRRPRRRPVASP